MIKINNATVPLSISTKLFGIYIDNNLTWNAHIKYIDSKISKGVCLVFRHIIELPHEILLLIYNTLILPFTCNTYINKSYTTKKKALRIFSNSLTYCHTSPIIKSLGLVNIHQLIQYHPLISIFQQQHYLLPNLYEHKFIIVSKCHTYDDNIDNYIDNI